MEIVTIKQRERERERIFITFFTYLFDKYSRNSTSDWIINKKPQKGKCKKTRTETFLQDVSVEKQTTHTHFQFD